MIPINKVRELIPGGTGYTDKQLENIRENLYIFAEIILESYLDSDPAKFK